MNIWLVESDSGDDRPSLALSKLATLHREQSDSINHVILRSGYRFPDRKPDKIYVSIIFSWDLPKFVEFINLTKKAYPHLRDGDIEIGGVAPYYMRDYILEQTGIEPFTGCSAMLDHVLPDVRFYEEYYTNRAILFAERVEANAQKAKIKAEQSDIYRDKDNAITSALKAQRLRQKADRMVSGDIRPVDLRTFVFTQRGCSNNCTYCVVPHIEGTELSVISNWKEQINLRAKEVVLCDNNILAAPYEHRKDVFEYLAEIASAEGTIIPNSKNTIREVSLDGGLDHRRINDENIELIRKVKWSKIRMAWDDIRYEEKFKEAMQRMLDVFGKKSGLNDHFEVYVLYNCEHTKDTVEDTLYRVYALFHKFKVLPYVMRYQALTTLEYKKHLSPYWDEYDAGDIGRWVNDRQIFKTVQNFAHYCGRKADGRTSSRFNPEVKQVITPLKEIPFLVDVTRPFKENADILRRQMEQRREILNRYEEKAVQLKLAI